MGFKHVKLLAFCLATAACLALTCASRTVTCPCSCSAACADSSCFFCSCSTCAARASLLDAASSCCALCCSCTCCCCSASCCCWVCRADCACWSAASLSAVAWLSCSAITPAPLTACDKTGVVFLCQQRTFAAGQCVATATCCGRSDWPNLSLLSGSAVRLQHHAAVQVQQGNPGTGAEHISQHRRSIPYLPHIPEQHDRRWSCSSTTSSDALGSRSYCLYCNIDLLVNARLFTRVSGSLQVTATANTYLGRGGCGLCRVSCRLYYCLLSCLAGQD